MHSLFMIKSSICTYLGEPYLVSSFDSIYISEIICHMLLELFSESSLYHVYLVGSNPFIITSLCCHQLPKRGRLKHLGPYLYFGN
jgi:hypothetical protein